MKAIAKLMVIAVFATVAVSDIRAEDKQVVLLLQEASTLFGRAPAFQDRGELTHYLDRTFTVGMSELDVRRKVFAILELLEAGPRTHIGVGFRENWLELGITQIDQSLTPEFGGPVQWNLAIGFHFDSSHKLKRSVHTVSFGHWDGPLDEGEKTELNQPLRPTTTAVTPAASHPSRQP